MFRGIKCDPINGNRVENAEANCIDGWLPAERTRTHARTQLPNGEEN